MINFFNPEDYIFHLTVEHEAQFVIFPGLGLLSNEVNMKLPENIASLSEHQS